MTRAAVHAATGHPLGAADPRQEGPADLRLVPPALAAWAAAALATGAPGDWTAGAVLAGLALAGVLLVRAALVPARRGRRAGAGARDVRRRVNGVAVAAVLLCAAAGAGSAWLHGADRTRGPVPGLAERYARVTVDLTVTSDPRPTRPRVRGDSLSAAGLVLDADLTRVTATDGAVTTLRTPVLVFVQAGGGAGAWQRLLPSTGLRLAGRLAPPLEGDVRYAAALRVEGSGPPRVVRPPTGPQRTAGDLRAGLREATEELPPDARALLPGLVVGDTSRIPPELHDAFTATDLSHLLAVSGSNLTIVLALLIGPPGLALRAERRGLAPRLGISLRSTAVFGGALTLAFVVVCRPEPSVLRAAACGLITLLAIGTGRRRSLLPALAAAVLLLVLWDPALARSFGFVLSVAATGALLTIGPRWSAAMQRRGVPPRLAEVLAAAASAQAVCAPVVAVFAARVSLVAVPCNLFAELAVAPATVLGFAALATAPVAMPAAELLARCAGWPVEWIASVARTGASLPGAEAEWPGGWRGGALLAGITVLVVCAVRRIRGPWVAAGCVVLLLLAILRPAPLTRMVTGWPPPGWALAMCDVGQGDTMVLAAGDGAGVVVDAGPDPKLADRCLRDLGITRVPLLVVSHFHADHVTGLPGVLRGRRVGAIQTTPLQEPWEQSAFVRRTAEAAGVPLVRATPGERRRVGPLDWRVLWPRAGPGLGAGGPNDASVTLFVRTAGGTTLLLLGDLEPPAQQGLSRDHPTLPPVDVLKVAHHGSAFQDPGLLRTVRPRLALISCGRDNPYGHPSPRTVGALRAGGAVVMRTDTDGAVAVTGAGEGLRAVARGPG
ncbi:ComEC/Rec2 family competence protein [Streptomyces sp. NP-1717]|uniref:ComEC/Rec2 family competence protein n=1 Tax=unclassified Streptomyces TaxID=2593676 RepID=UPI001F5CBA03|nr:ComEC/Rec2 family competence protein [Streptomyces sp. NP-1717]MCI3224828.1 MBL fold metallo-hydrolase [Streptomyces sp. NP-1717]WTA73319.1 ComEC/Rec2 family competence protein [Streptomyces sp. NBC_00838]